MTGTGIRTKSPLMRLRIRHKLLTGLREQYVRLERESAHNPGPTTWDEYVSTLLLIGLEHLKTMSDVEVLALLEGS